jgi:hypothetical protein
MEAVYNERPGDVAGIEELLFLKKEKTLFRPPRKAGLHSKLGF